MFFPHLLFVTRARKIIGNINQPFVNKGAFQNHPLGHVAAHPSPCSCHVCSFIGVPKARDKAAGDLGANKGRHYREQRLKPFKIRRTGNPAFNCEFESAGFRRGSRNSGGYKHYANTRPALLYRVLLLCQHALWKNSIIQTILEIKFHPVDNSDVPHYYQFLVQIVINRDKIYVFYIFVCIKPKFYYKFTLLEQFFHLIM